MTTRVTISRAKLYPVVSRPGPAWQWIYSYSADGAPEIEYGTGLAAFRRWLRKLFPGAEIVQAWDS